MFLFITNQAPSLMFPVKNNEGPELNIQLWKNLRENNDGKLYSISTGDFAGIFFWRIFVVWRSDSDPLRENFDFF